MLVSSLARELNSEVPGIECDEDKVKILGCQVLGSKSVESRDGISKVTRVSNMFPSQGCQARYRGVNALADIHLLDWKILPSREKQEMTRGFVERGGGL